MARKIKETFLKLLVVLPFLTLRVVLILMSYGQNKWKESLVFWTNFAWKFDIFSNPVLKLSSQEHFLDSLKSYDNFKLFLFKVCNQM